MARRELARNRPDTATMSWRQALFGGGGFALSGQPRDEKGWRLYELGQQQFWAVPDAVAWDEPVREDPEYAEAIAAMLAFLCPGEKAAVTAASAISGLVPTEEAKFYFCEQALEESKHFDALRRIVPKITGRPMDPVKPSVRALYTFGVLDEGDVAFMMGNVNIIGEQLANQIFCKIRPFARSPQLRTLLALIQRDESRHVAAGRRFYGEVYDVYKKNRRKIMAKNLATTLLLGIAARDLVNPMAKLGLDLEDIMARMYDHYEDVVGAFPPFPEQALLDAVVRFIRKSTPTAIRNIGAMTTEDGELDYRRLLGAADKAVRSPRALRHLFAYGA